MKIFRNRTVMLCLLLFLLAGQTLMAQDRLKPTKQFELFCGLDLGYADTNWLRLYDIQLNVMPGVRWNLGNDWTIAAQGLIPVVSVGYTFDSTINKYWRVNMAVVSKQLHFNRAKQHLRLSAGWFNRERYGLDVRWAWPVNSWLMLHARAGLTAHWILGSDFKDESAAELDTDFSLTGIAGANFYVNPWDIELRASGGRYVNGDYGTQVDVMRHFKHCTLLLFAQLRIGDKIKNRFDKNTYTTNAGFKVIVMLPPYKKSTRRFVVRPASNFRLTNNINSDGMSMKMYNTDPEENEREYMVDVPWGVNSTIEEGK